MTGHRSQQRHEVASGCRSGIVCVEWTEPVSAVWCMRHGAGLRGSGEYTTYIIEHLGETLYVGSTRNDVAVRLRKHWITKTRPMAAILRRHADDTHGPTVRWTSGSAMFEFQVQKALRPRFNKLNPHWRNVPLLPDRRAA